MKFTKKPKKEKAESIIKAAQTRFGLYGVEKTSMREIANDIQMSKGSLYYYFPDKENLYKAVIEKEHSEFLRIMEDVVKNIPDPSDCLRKYAENRLSYFKSLLNLSRIRPEALSEYKPLVAITMNELREKEKNIVIKIMERGKSNGQFNIEDINKTASLFLDLLRGLRVVVLKNKKLLIIDDEEYTMLSAETTAFTEIFIKGLRFREKN